MFGNVRDRGLPGIALVAITYVYFLIFAQFAFLGRLAEEGTANTGLKIVMASMALSGILFSLLVARVSFCPSPTWRLRAGFGICAAAALLTQAPLNLLGAAGVASAIGGGLGVVTVTLATHLRMWTGSRQPILKAAIGTGLGYFICNIPAVFTASPESQCLLAFAMCVAGSVMTSAPTATVETAAAHSVPRFNFPRVLTSLAALVWLDSAAFYIIQHVPALKAGTWTGSLHLWLNAGLHLGAAVVSGLLLERHRVGTVLTGAYLALGFACMLLLHSGLALPASLFYPVGVSLYSVTLVAYPSFLTSATAPERARQAGWIYAIAGWMGSAMGIGMGQNLGRVPPAFVLAAGAAIAGPALFGLFRFRLREAALLCASLLVALLLYRVSGHGNAKPLSAVARGQQVYISEGCIHCHSQYVRPNSPDELMWGPIESAADLHEQRPPLIGNRRQGPDLSQIGARRSLLWLKAHLVDPVEVSGGSFMPSYGFLFRDRRGDDLVAYLVSLHGSDAAKQLALQRKWDLNATALAHADVEQGERLYQRHCATCHDAEGRTLARWRAEFQQAPTNLTSGPFHSLDPSASAEVRLDRFARIAKFGIAGTDMPGHEYLSDQQIASLSLWLMQQHPAQPPPHSQPIDRR